LPHPVAEPSLYVAIDVGVEMLQTLLAALAHTKLSFLAPANSVMPPYRPPGVKAGRLD
jgi:hypothetical protein